MMACYSFIFASLLVFTAVGSTYQNRLFGIIDLDNAIIKCQTCHDIEEKIESVLTNKTRVNVTVNVLDKFFCRNKFLRPLPFVQDKCTQYVKSILWGLSESTNYIKKNVKLCDEALSCDKKLNIKRLKTKLAPVLFSLAVEVVKRNKEVGKVLRKAIFDSEDALKLVVENFCDAARKSKVSKPRSDRLDKQCNFVGGGPKCSLCGAMSDFADSFIDRSFQYKLQLKASKFICSAVESSKCKQVVMTTIVAVLSTLKNLLVSDFLCHRLNYCNEPTVFSRCDDLPGTSIIFCKAYTALRYKSLKKLEDTNGKLPVIDPKEACVTCSNVSRKYKSFLERNKDKLTGLLVQACTLVGGNYKDACVFFIEKGSERFFNQTTKFFDPDMLCPRIGLCHETSPKHADYSYYCDMCNTVVVFVQAKLDNVRLEKDIQKRFTKSCDRHPSISGPCKSIVGYVFEKAYDYIEENVQAKKLCGLFPQCKTPEIG